MIAAAGRSLQRQQSSRETLEADAAAKAAGFFLEIDFDNDSDPEATVIDVSGQNQTDLLAQLTGWPCPGG